MLALALSSTWSATACGKKRHHEHKDHRPIEDSWAAPAPPAVSGCERLPYAASIDVAEASGAVWLAGQGGARPVVLVTSDSGHRGGYVEVDAEDGRLLRKGKLPLGVGAGDDLEGLSTDGDHLWALTSAGWMRAWVRTPDGFRLVRGPYPIEEAGPCKVDAVNCGHDFEGLCLRPAGQVGADGCVGYAASRAAGALYCLTLVGGQPMIAPDAGDDAARPRARVTAKRALADCAIAADGAVWTGDNLIGGAMVRRLDAPTWRGALGDGFPEAMALGPGGVVYRFSDTGVKPSLAARYRCPAAAAGPAATTIALDASGAPSPAESP